MKPSTSSKSTAPSDRTQDRRRGPRKHRARPTPRWLRQQTEADDIARRRCLLVLSVLSGEMPVTDAIAAVGMSRGTYYKLEERALRAMMWALSPAAGPEGTEESVLAEARVKVVELEEKLRTLEKEKRRTDRMAMLVRKLVKPGPVLTPGRGRPKGSGSTPSGPSSSISSTSGKTETSPSRASTQTPDSVIGS